MIRSEWTPPSFDPVPVRRPTSWAPREPARELVRVSNRTISVQSRVPCWVRVPCGAGHAGRKLLPAQPSEGHAAGSAGVSGARFLWTLYEVDPLDLAKVGDGKRSTLG
jgi:hypothetical protein